MLKTLPIFKMLKQLFILTVLFLALFGCASSRMAEQLQSGKISFEDGNFKSAFHKLLPLASEGDASAEYAVGYMYYYGYGTQQDNESGLFWMRKSAEQHYKPAIKALEIISQNKTSEEPTQQLTAKQSVNIDSNQLLRSLTENTLDQPTLLENKNQTLSAKDPSSLVDSIQEKSTFSANTSADFNIEHAKKYTLQLMGSYNLADIKRTQNHLHIEKSSYLAHTQRNGKNWYILTYGKYSASYLAQLALDDLPKNIREMKPWVRPLGDIQMLA
jgi:hypothetical protein